MPQPANSLIPHSTAQLYPAEIAYLIRGGDINHAMIVLAVDLLQRSVKQHEDSSFKESLSEYEKNMLKIIKRALKEWTLEKTHSTVLGGARTPTQIAHRLKFLYRFVRESLHGLISGVLADPMQIRKYFSAQGVIRVVADFASAGYKASFHQELKTDLLRRGLIMDDRTRRKSGVRLIVFASILLVASFIVIDSGMHFVLLDLFYWLSTLVACVVAQLFLALRSLIPLYDEIALVADQIDRSSRRLALIKMILHSIRALVFSSVFLVLFSNFLFNMLILFMSGKGNQSMFVASALLINLCATGLIFKGLDFINRDHPTELARLQLQSLKQELKDRSPLDAFKTTLKDTYYDPTFSNLLAVYGAELLFILA